MDVFSTVLMIRCTIENTSIEKHRFSAICVKSIGEESKKTDPLFVSPLVVHTCVLVGNNSTNLENASDAPVVLVGNNLTPDVVYV